jgi:Skp family chaperone for outer membrane proteins
MFSIFKFLIIILFFFSSNHLLANEKIMFVDVNYIFSNSFAGKDITNKVKMDFNKSQKNLEILKNKLINDEKKLINQKNILSKEEFEKNLFVLKNEMDEFNNQRIKLNSEIDVYRNKLQSSFSFELSNVIQKYANENNIDLIIDKNTILVGKNVLDATKDVLELFDQNIKEIKIN